MYGSWKRRKRQWQIRPHLAVAISSSATDTQGLTAMSDIRRRLTSKLLIHRTCNTTCYAAVRIGRITDAALQILPVRLSVHQSIHLPVFPSQLEKEKRAETKFGANAQNSDAPLKMSSSQLIQLYGIEPKE